MQHCCIALFAMFAFAACCEDTDPSKDEAWEEFKMMFCKTYSSPEEEYERRLIFEDNLYIIDEHNAIEGSSYKLGINSYSDHDSAEVLKYRTGFRANEPFDDDTVKEFKPSNNLGAVPSIDWRDKGLVTDVKDQGECGCCYAFSAIGAIEAQVKNKTGELVRLSEQNILDCSRDEGNDGCDGGWMSQSYKYIMNNGGISTEDSYPYEEAEGSCRYDESNSGATVSNYMKIPSGDEDALKEAVASVGPVSIAINANGDFQSYQSGIYDPDDCPNDIEDMNHAVLIVGYDTEDGKDYWIIKNSWGESWGEEGYMKIVRNKDNVCGLATRATYPVL